MKLRVKSIWFSDTISSWRFLSLTEYLRSPEKGWRFGYVREVFYTKLIDLRRSEEDILAGLSTQARRKVRRADKEGIVYEVSNDIDGFVRFFNRFAQQKQLSYRLKAETIKKKTKNYKITRALKDGELLFSHLYLCDPEKRRAVLLYGGSILRDKSKRFSNGVISSANRGLHYFDMRVLKADNIDVYDMCGYAPGTKNAELQRINDFKDEFGGILVCETDYRSVVLHVASTVLNFFVRRYREPARKFISLVLRGGLPGSAARE